MVHPQVANYFAIGAMMNPVSMSNRNVNPIRSEPAELLNYRLEFFSKMGFADVVPDSGSSLHGVLHQVQAEDMKTLDDIEGSFYKRHAAKARTYDGTVHDVTVYSCHNRKPEDVSIPTERYLDVLVEGAQHHGVQESYIEWLKQHEKKPRPLPNEFLTFAVDDFASLPTVPFADVERNNGLEGRPLWMSINGKVLEAQFPPNEKQVLENYVQDFQSGCQTMELFVGKVIYDPKYGVVKSMDDVTEEYAAWCEHFLVEVLGVRGHLSFWKVIGKRN